MRHRVRDFIEASVTKAGTAVTSRGGDAAITTTAGVDARIRAWAAARIRARHATHAHGRGQEHEEEGFSIHGRTLACSGRALNDSLQALQILNRFLSVGPEASVGIGLSLEKTLGSCSPLCLPESGDGSLVAQGPRLGHGIPAVGATVALLEIELVGIESIDLVAEAHFVGNCHRAVSCMQIAVG